MKKTTKQASSPRRRKDDDRLTTAEISLLRERKRMHRHMVTAVIGLGLMAAGTAMYLSPHANASDDAIIEELDVSQITNDGLQFTDADFALSNEILDEMRQEEQAPTPSEKFLSPSEEEVKARLTQATEECLPEDGAYDPTTLIVTMASDTTQDDANALIADTGAEVITMFSEADGTFGASFSLRVPDGKPVLDLYREILSSRKVYSCGFNLLIQTASVQTDDQFMLNGATDWTDGNDNPDGDLTLNQLDNLDVFEDPAETYGDLKSAQGEQGFQVHAESLDPNGFELVEDDPASAERWEYQQLRYEDAWHVAKTNGRVTVAIMDTGVNASHRDLRNLIHNPVMIDDAGKATEVPKSQMTDTNGHGTHVAGVIGAQANNKFGVSGISYNARIMPIKLAERSNGAVYLSAVTGAFDYIADKNKEDLTNAQKNNVRVVNVSLCNAVSQEVANGWVRDLALPLERLNQSGTLVVTAAGNANSDGQVPFISVPSYKGDGKDEAENTLSVINLEAGDKATDAPHRRPTSNYNLPGRHDCEIAAPGTNIYATTNTSDHAFTRLTGTSQAAPIVSGTAALMFAANPDLTPAQAKQVMFETAIDLGKPGFDDEYGYGEVNPVDAVAKAASTATVDDEMDIGKANSAALADVKLKVNGQSFPAFSYDKIGYDLEYNGMRDNLVDTQFEFHDIPTGYSLYRRVSDLKYGDIQTNASDNVTYRDISQVVTFLFAKTNGQENPSLIDTDVLQGIYAFYIKYKLIITPVRAESDDQAGADDAIVTAESVSQHNKVIEDMILVAGDSKRQVAKFNTLTPGKQQTLEVGSPEDVNVAPSVIGLTDGFVATVIPQDEAHQQDVTTEDKGEIKDAYVRNYNITVSNNVEEYDYPTMLYAESYGSPSAMDSPIRTQSLPQSNEPTPDSANLKGSVPWEISQQDSPASTPGGGDWGTSSETPTSDFKELSKMTCKINSKPYNEFNYEKTSYIINFPVGSTLPGAPQLSVPSGWSQSGVSTSEIPSSPKFPYGGTRHAIAVSKGTLRRQYEFSYSFYSDGKGGAASAKANQTTANTQQSQGTRTASTPASGTTVADTPTQVSTTYVQGGEGGTQGDGTQGNGVVTVDTLSGEQTQAVNNVNAPGTSGGASTSGGTGTGTGTTKSIANTSPLTNFVSGGRLTQTGDAVVIACGGAITVFGVGSVILARKRLRNLA